MAMAVAWLIVSVILFSPIANQQSVVTADADQRQIYIVYMGTTKAAATTTMSGESYYLNLLEKVIEDRSPQESLIYSYGKSFNGFAVWLTETERRKLISMKNVISVFPSKTRQVQTTRSWDFLGLPVTVNRLPEAASDIIVGVIDTGIWPESLSFDDDEIGPPPSKWKGTCQNFICNNKIIGARVYETDDMDDKSPRDTEGHGTHVASTIAGREVENASFFGIAKGLVRGAVPSARIAVYKVCDRLGCDSYNILAAMDDAIADGVDIISISLGSGTKEDYFEDEIAIGSFHAMQNGILVSASAGNSGPQLWTVENYAPWMLTVAANTIDRKIISNVTLGNSVSIEGLGVNAFPTTGALPLIDTKSMEGKIFVSDGVYNGNMSLEHGARGAVMLSKDLEDVAYSFPLPTTVISNADDIQKIKSYVSSRNPTAIIHQGVGKYDSNAPTVASFSSRGPNRFSPLVLKPDLSAPGVDILAAYSPKGKVSQYDGDKRSVTYYILSGTSMACPHATGAAAYVKSFHPTWSPASIKSALMTTASPMKNVDLIQGEFAYGSGQIDPVKAADPGLVYEALESDYTEMLCNLNYSKEIIGLISDTNITCGEVKGDETLLNYPSMTHFVDSKQPFTRYFPRKVTNVGSANSIYKATISTSQPLLYISVTPNILSFKSLNEKQDFNLTISGGVFETNGLISASLTWSDGVHNVRSPIVVLVQVQKLWSDHTL